MRRLPLLLCALMLIPCFTARAQDAEYKPPRKWTFGMFGGAFDEKLKLSQGGARDEDGKIAITVGDRLLKWNGEDLKDRDDFCRRLYATKPGDVVEIEFAHTEKGKDGEEIKTAKIKLGDAHTAFPELYTHLDKRKRTYDWRDSPTSRMGHAKLVSLVRKHGIEQEWDNLIAAHERELDLWNSYENLSSTDLLLGNPLSAHAWMQEVGNKVADRDRSNIALLLHRLLDGPEGEKPKPPAPDLELDDIQKAVRDALSAFGHVVRPSDDTPPDEWKDIRESVSKFSFAWRGEEGFSESSHVVDRMRLLEFNATASIEATNVLSSIAYILGSLVSKPALRPPPPAGVDLSKFVEGDAFCFETSFGLVAVGGIGRNIWTGGPEAPVLIVDKGGDDEYVDCAVTDGEHQLSLVVDLEGNDHYRSTGKWGVACGMLGTAIIEDVAGNDTYECGEWGIGAAFGGLGLVIDRKGNDRYLGGTNSIGCAAYGVGGVIDLEGNDIYDSHGYSIGSGQPGGVGFVLDHAGDDRYRCTGNEPSGYGTEGEWMGGGIGCGWGWRTLACGGIGLVVDVKGNDIYDAGEFGLACGYFMGIGAVRDMAGDDIYHSSRYGLAAAAHAGVGVFMDDKGNDVYEGKTAASMAGVWDIATGYFYDGAGDDYYHCDGLGLGAAAQNAFGIFWDAEGKDVYRGAKSTLGNAGGTTYSAGRLAKNFGIFMDTGGGEDSYPRDDRKNDIELVEQEYAIFLDE